MKMHSKTKDTIPRLSQLGFTLIELMIVVAIVGIISAIAIPSYLSWKPGYIARGAVSKVSGDLKRAKMRALETRRQCRVVFTTNGYQILDGNQARSSSQWGNISATGVFTNGTPFRTINFNDFPDVTLTEDDCSVIAAATAPTMTYSPRGTSENDSVQVRHLGIPRAVIRVSILGRVNVE